MIYPKLHPFLLVPIMACCGQSCCADVLYTFTDNGSGGVTLTASGTGVIDGLTTTGQFNFITTASASYLRIEAHPDPLDLNQADNFDLLDYSHAITGSADVYTTTFSSPTTNTEFALNNVVFDFPEETFIDYSSNGITGFELDSWSPQNPFGNPFLLYTDFMEPAVPSVTFKTGWSIDSISGSFSDLTIGLYIFENAAGGSGSNRIVFDVSAATVPEPSSITLIALCGLSLAGVRSRVFRNAGNRSLSSPA